jgi:hypothetical protein
MHCEPIVPVPRGRVKPFSRRGHAPERALHTRFP